VHKLLTYLIATVWLVNGLVCKVLGLVPRHQQIVARILGDEYAQAITIMIGLGEVLLAIWILTGIRSRICAVIQIALVLLMNVIEFFIAPDLLLFGRVNFIVAIVFAALVYFNEFLLNKEPA
jgi:uncharacterized membrane protein YphA (DoxX/SURF4 family)